MNRPYASSTGGGKRYNFFENGTMPQRHKLFCNEWTGTPHQFEKRSVFYTVGPDFLRFFLVACGSRRPPPPVYFLLCTLEVSCLPCKSKDCCEFFNDFSKGLRFDTFIVIYLSPLPYLPPFGPFPSGFMKSRGSQTTFSINWELQF